MTDTPPSLNPERWAANTRKHWADITEIKPGVFSVMEGSGPRATTRDFTIVQRTPASGDWSVVGRVYRPRYGNVMLDVPYGYFRGRSWKIVAPEVEAPKLVAQLIEIAKEFA